MSCQLNLWVQQLPHHATTALPRKPRLSSSSLSGQFAAYLRSENPYFPCLGHVQPSSNASKAKKYQEVLEFQCLKGCAFSVKVVLMQNEDCLSLLGFMETFINMKNSRINQFGNVWQYGVKKSFNALPSMRFPSSFTLFRAFQATPWASLRQLVEHEGDSLWNVLPETKNVSRTNHWLIGWTKSALSSMGHFCRSTNRMMIFHDVKPGWIIPRRASFGGACFVENIRKSLMFQGEKIQKWF